MCLTSSFSFFFHFLSSVLSSWQRSRCILFLYLFSGILETWLHFFCHLLFRCILVVVSSSQGGRRRRPVGRTGCLLPLNGSGFPSAPTDNRRLLLKGLLIWSQVMNCVTLLPCSGPYCSYCKIECFYKWMVFSVPLLISEGFHQVHVCIFIMLITNCS